MVKNCEQNCEQTKGTKQYLFMVIVYANDENGSVDNVLRCDRLQLIKRSLECFYQSYLIEWIQFPGGVLFCDHGTNFRQAYDYNGGQKS